jgi:hypothetical protein
MAVERAIERCARNDLDREFDEFLLQLFEAALALAPDPDRAAFRDVADSTVMSRAAIGRIGDADESDGEVGSCGSCCLVDASIAASCAPPMTTSIARG